MMQDNTKRERPECKLIGENGNIYNLLGIASDTLKRYGLHANATEMCDRVFRSGSYQEALDIIQQYVEVI